jgi:hypothetical protein
MNLAGVQVGDVVLADRKGRRFYAIVTAKEPGGLAVEPIDRRSPTTTCAPGGMDGCQG